MWILRYPGAFWGPWGGSWQAGEAGRRLVIWLHHWNGDLLLFLCVWAAGPTGVSQDEMRQLGRAREAETATTHCHRAMGLSALPLAMERHLGESQV